jgi:hypothetical protein
MEVGVAFDDVLIVEEVTASCSDNGIEVIDRFEVLVGERFVDQGPEVLGGLEFGAVSGLIDEPDAVGDRQVLRAVPSGIVELENDDAIASGAGLLREGFEQFGKERLVDPVRQIPNGFAARRRDESGDVEPFVAVVAQCDRPLAGRCPDPAMDRLQTEPMFIRRPDLDRLVRMLGGLFGDRGGKFFLNSASSSGVAAFGFFGRGDWIDQPIARNASQPRCEATCASPSRPAINSATLRLLHNPPSGGGSLSRSFNSAKSSGLSTEAVAPLWRRRSPSACGPSAL